MELVDNLLKGSQRALARIISYIENDTPEAQEALSHLYPYTGNAYSIGVTGSPGTGKSVLVTVLTQYLRQQNKTVGIIAVDPTSPFTGGAVLGDRFRMRELSEDSGVFIRSMATRGQLGGLARTTFDVMRAMDAAGYGYVIIETVGAGQNEVEIAKVADTTVLVEAPGMGDDIQAIKAGILEIADVIAVNKADRPGVKQTVKALQAMLDLGHRKRTVVHHGQSMTEQLELVDDMWMVPLVQTVATKAEGIAELAAAIEKHRAYLSESGIRSEQQRIRLHNELLNRLQAALLNKLLDEISVEQMTQVIDQMMARELDPAGAVRRLMHRG